MCAKIAIDTNALGRKKSYLASSSVRKRSAVPHCNEQKAGERYLSESIIRAITANVDSGLARLHEELFRHLLVASLRRTCDTTPITPSALVRASPDQRRSSPAKRYAPWARTISTLTPSVASSLLVHSLKPRSRHDRTLSPTIALGWMVA